VEAKLRGAAFQDTGFHGMRPGVPLVMKVRLDLWRRFLDERALQRAAAEEEAAKAEKDQP